MFKDALNKITDTAVAAASAVPDNAKRVGQAALDTLDMPWKYAGRPITVGLHDLGESAFSNDFMSALVEHYLNEAAKRHEASGRIPKLNDKVGPWLDPSVTFSPFHPFIVSHIDAMYSGNDTPEQRQRIEEAKEKRRQAAGKRGEPTDHKALLEAEEELYNARMGNNPAASFITEMLMDPTNLIGAGLGTKALKARHVTPTFIEEGGKLIRSRRHDFPEFLRQEYLEPFSLDSNPMWYYDNVPTPSTKFLKKMVGDTSSLPNIPIVRPQPWATPKIDEGVASALIEAVARRRNAQAPSSFLDALLVRLHDEITGTEFTGIPYVLGQYIQPREVTDMLSGLGRYLGSSGTDLITSLRTIPTKSNKGIVDVFADADIDTLVHELGHHIRMSLRDDEFAEASRLYNKGSSTWDDIAEELFATDFVRYVSNGRLKNRSMMGPFERIKAELYDLFRIIPKNARLPYDVQQYWSSILSGKR